MIKINTQKPSPDAGYFEKNFPKLMAFRHKDYMWGRMAVAAAGTVLTLLFAADAFFFHSSNGELVDYVKVVGIIFLTTVLRKTILRLLEAADKTNVVQFVEPPHNPEESTWVRLGFWLPFGQRRGLNGFISRTTECFFIALMAFALIGMCVRGEVFELPGFVPQIFAKVTFPVESWLALGIAEIALIISWLNNSIFLMRYAKVRNAVTGTLGKVLGGRSLLKAIGLEAFEFFQEKKAQDPDCHNEALATEVVAKVMLSAHPDKEAFRKDYDELFVMLVAELNKNSYDTSNVELLVKFLDARIEEIKKRTKPS